MATWVRDFNSLYAVKASEAEVIDAYVRAHVSFVRIHPFFDGNGRLARLLSNLPVLYAGYPPIVVPMEVRAEYINALWTYQRQVGSISLANPELLPQPELLQPLKEQVRGWWQSTLDLIR